MHSFLNKSAQFRHKYQMNSIAIHNLRFELEPHHHVINVNILEYVKFATIIIDLVTKLKNVAMNVPMCPTQKPRANIKGA